MIDVVCPVCGKDEFVVEVVNGVRVKKCKGCGGYYQLAQEECETNSFVPVYERYDNGTYPGCPRCGSTHFRKIHAVDTFPEIPFAVRLRRGSHRHGDIYLCLNPDCFYTWD